MILSASFRRNISREAFIAGLVIGAFTLLLCLPKCESLNSNDSNVIKYTDAGDISIGYKTMGSGYPIIMIMGLTGTMDIWDPNVLSALASKYLVIIFDNRGMGETSAGTKEWSIEQFADDTANFMDSLGLTKAHILGWSMGTNVALELALRHSSKVDKLVLYAADCGGSEAIQPSEKTIEKMMSGDFDDLLEVLFPEDWLTENYYYITNLFSRISTETTSEENKQRQYEALQNWAGCCSELNSIVNQTLLITGDEDIGTPTQNSYIMELLLPNFTLVVMNDGGHGIMYQYPESFSENILKFLIRGSNL